MKKAIIFSCIVLATVAAMSGCKKNSFASSQREYPAGKSFLKLGLFQANTVIPNLLIYINGERVSGPIAPPYPYPGGGFNTGGLSNGDYFEVPAGSTKIELYIPNPGTAIPASKYFETTQTLEADKKTTLYMTDTNANTVVIPVIDNASQPDTASTRIRFINLIPNSTGVDFYKGNTLLKSNVKFKDVIDFFDIPYGSDSFHIRAAGAPAGTALSGIAYRVIAPLKQRIYTFVSRGYIGQTGTRAPNVSAVVNQ